MDWTGHWTTCAEDHREHFVTDEALRHGRDEGVAETVCGHVLLVAAATAAFGRRCAACAAVLRCRTVPQRGGAARHRAPGLLRRVLHPH